MYLIVSTAHKPTHLQEGLLSVLHPSVCERLYRSRGKEVLLRRAYPNLLQGSGIVCAGHPERGACKVSMGIQSGMSFTQRRELLLRGQGSRHTK